MTDTIEKVTLESAAEQLKAKIRNAFVELLPEEQWKAMVMAELKRFTESKTTRDSYNSREIVEPSEFSKICSEVFKEHVKTQIQAVLVSPEWQSPWGRDGKQQISDAIKSWLTDNSAALIQTTVQTLAAQAAQTLGI